MIRSDFIIRHSDFKNVRLCYDGVSHKPHGILSNNYDLEAVRRGGVRAVFACCTGRASMVARKPLEGCHSGCERLSSAVCARYLNTKLPAVE